MICFVIYEVNIDVHCPFNKSLIFLKKKIYVILACDFVVEFVNFP